MRSIKLCTLSDVDFSDSLNDLLLLLFQLKPLESIFYQVFFLLPPGLREHVGQQDEVLQQLEGEEQQLQLWPGHFVGSVYDCDIPDDEFTSGAGEEDLGGCWICGALNIGVLVVGIVEEGLLSLHCQLGGGF